LPPRTEVGDTEMPASPIGLIVRVAVTDVAPAVAVIVGADPVVEANVIIVNVAVLDPAATVTVAGTVALELLEVSVRTVPPAGAALEIVTVAVDELPAMTVVGDNDKAVGSMRFRTLLTIPERMGAPHPDAVSHPGPAVEVWLFGKRPFVPEITSKKTVGSPFQE